MTGRTAPSTVRVVDADWMEFGNLDYSSVTFSAGILGPAAYLSGIFGISRIPGFLDFWISWDNADRCGNTMSTLSTLST